MKTSISPARMRYSRRAALVGFALAIAERA
jgi:hypothetical protein